MAPKIYHSQLYWTGVTLGVTFYYGVLLLIFFAEIFEIFEKYFSEIWKKIMKNLEFLEKSKMFHLVFFVFDPFLTFLTPSEHFKGKSNTP